MQSEPAATAIVGDDKRHFRAVLACATSEEMRAATGLISASCALQDEPHSIAGHVAGHQVALVQLGVGRETAAKNLQRFLDDHIVQEVLLFGFSGGLTEQWSVGDLLLGQRLSSSNSREVVASVPVAKIGSARFGCLVTVDQPALTTTAKRQLHHATQADAVDMETAAIVKLCQQRGHRIIVMRAISDVVGDSIDCGFFAALRPNGDISMLRVVLMLLARPWLIPSAIHLARSSGKALRALRAGLQFYLDGLKGVAFPTKG